MSKICANLHSLLHKGLKFGFSMKYDTFPQNGIYIMFEKGELGHGGDRIVRIGTHTGDKELENRIFQHFENENKNRSIFRKNIGRCILKKSNKQYLSIWDLDTTRKDDKERHSSLINHTLEKKIEKQISKYIQENISYCLFKVQSKEERKFFEMRLISTVSGCSECCPSETWLGNLSPKKKIKESGLWQEQELYKQPLSDEELSALSSFLVQK